jgi:hypothetical protein
MIVVVFEMGQWDREVHRFADAGAARAFATEAGGYVLPDDEETLVAEQSEEEVGKVLARVACEAVVRRTNG